MRVWKPSFSHKTKRGIVVELWATILEWFGKTSRWLQNAKCYLKSTAGQILECLRSFEQILHPLVSEFEDRYKPLTLRPQKQEHLTK